MAICSQYGHQVDFLSYAARDNYIGTKSVENPARVAERILLKNPDVVGFSCVTDNYRTQLAVAEELKKTLPNLKNFFGGIHPTSVPERVIKQSAVDTVFIGEAEISLPLFLAACVKDEYLHLPEAPIQGVLHKVSNKIWGDISSEGELSSLDTLPFPFKTPVYRQLPFARREYGIMTSRGCPYRCSYCFNSHYYAKRGKTVFRQRSVENVISELTEALSSYNFQFVHFLDDSFTTNERWIVAFCEKYRERINRPFVCSVNPHYFNETIATALSLAGCVDVQIGVQSLSERLCAEVLERKSDNTAIGSAVRLIKKYNMLVQVDHLLGIPGDRTEYQEESIRYYNRVRPSIVSVFWLTYYPRTKIIAHALKAGALSPQDVDLLEEGLSAGTRSLHAGGSMANPDKFLGVAFLLNYLPLLPQKLVQFLVDSGLYRHLTVSNYLFATAIPRLIRSLLDSRYVVGRNHIRRFYHRILH